VENKRAMKIKTSVVWLVVVVFLVSEIMLFSTSRQKDKALVALHAEQDRVEQLQAKVEELQNSSSTSEAAEVTRLRADNQSLPRLRNQVTQLQAANQKLTQQLNATLTAAQQQQSQLEQVAAEGQQARAAAQEANAVLARNACINNLRQIDAAKQQWALEKNKPAEAIPTLQDIAPYIKLDANGNIPGCPAGGTYTLNAVGELPSCSIPGHVLPQ
jgi:chromosome segregation ATPase